MGIKDIYREKCAADRALRAYKELQLTGCVIKMDRKVCTFSF